MNSGQPGMYLVFKQCMYVQTFTGKLNKIILPYRHFTINKFIEINKLCYEGSSRLTKKMISPRLSVLDLAKKVYHDYLHDNRLAHTTCSGLN